MREFMFPFNFLIFFLKNCKLSFVLNWQKYIGYSETNLTSIVATTHQPQSLWTCGKPIRLEAANYIYDSITRTDAADETAMITQWIFLQK